MNPDAVFNRYDVRGDYPDEIDEEFAERLGRAAGALADEMRETQVIVGRDTREASEAVADAFTDGVCSTGMPVVDTGIGTTDRTALAASHYGGIGVMVTASHHSWDRTGFKFLYRKGHGFSNDDLARVQRYFEDNPHGGGDGGSMHVQHEFDETYMERVTEKLDAFVDGIDARVVVDAVGGSERVASGLFDELGAEVIPVERTERPHPEPTAARREDVQRLVRDEDADIAVGYDPDGDRVYVIHPELGWVDGDRLFYLLARITGPDTIAASVDTSPLIEEFDADITYTRVGDVFVSAEGVEIDAELLGEPNGHYAVTDFCWYNSGIFASLLLAAHHDELPAMLAPVAAYSTERFVQAYDDMEARDAAMQQLKKRVAKHYDLVDRVDGMRFDADGLTCLVRPSGSSAKIRLIVHGAGDIGESAAAVRDTLFPD